MAILKFLFHNTPSLFSNTSITAHFMVASCDTNHNIVSNGEDTLKRLSIDYENEQVSQWNFRGIDKTCI